MSRAASVFSALAPLAVALLFTVATVLAWSERHPPGPVAGTDAEQYLQFAGGLLRGDGFSGRDGPTLYREPGYSVLLALLGHSDDREPGTRAFILVQAILLGLSAACAALLARWAGLGQWAASAVGALAGTSLTLVDLARQALSEPLAFALLMLGFTTFVHATRTRRPLWFGLAGLFVGRGTLVRVPAMAIGLAFFLTWASIQVWQRRPLRAVALRAGLGGALLLLVVAPWTARNWVHFDTPSITTRSGMGLARRAVRATYPPEYQARWVVAAGWVALNPLSDLVVPQERFAYGDLYFQSYLWDFHTNEARWAGTRYDRVCRFENLDSCERDIGLDIIVHHPLAYVLQTPLEWVKLNFYPLPSAVAADRNLRVWLALAAFALLAVRGRLRGPLGWTALLIGFYTAVHLPFDLQERYGTALLPAYSLLAVAGAVEVLRALQARRRAPAVVAEARSGNLATVVETAR